MTVASHRSRSALRVIVWCVVLAGLATGSVALASPEAHGQSFSFVDFLFNWPTEENHRIGFFYLLVNFGVLLLLINRLVFRNLVNQNAARHEEIKESLANATKASAEAERVLAEFDAKLGQIDRERGQILGEARALANAERDRILEEARVEARKIHEAAIAAAERDAEARRAVIEREIVDQAITKAEAILIAQFSEADHRRVVDEFVDKLERAPLSVGGAS
ncbi:MAG: ATP synthase F0 subunit B [Nannocystaceae bacterium]|nr:ATP synthase F0 subunit B [Myxococcales bacterium]